MYDMRDEADEQNFVKKACFTFSSERGSEYFMNKRSYILILGSINLSSNTAVIIHCRQLCKNFSSCVGVIDA